MAKKSDLSPRRNHY